MFILWNDVLFLHSGGQSIEGAVVPPHQSDMKKKLEII